MGVPAVVFAFRRKIESSRSPDAIEKGRSEGRKSWSINLYTIVYYTANRILYVSYHRELSIHYFTYGQYNSVWFVGLPSLYNVACNSTYCTVRFKHIHFFSTELVRYKRCVNECNTHIECEVPIINKKIFRNMKKSSKSPRRLPNTC